jgi:hypothetical protein
MTDEQMIIKAFRGSDARGKASIIQYATSMAEDWPEQLHRAVGFVDAPELADGKLDDVEPPTIIGPAV